MTVAEAAALMNIAFSLIPRMVVIGSFFANSFLTVCFITKQIEILVSLQKGKGTQKGEGGREEGKRRRIGVKGQGGGRRNEHTI